LLILGTTRRSGTAADERSTTHQSEARPAGHPAGGVPGRGPTRPPRGRGPSLRRRPGRRGARPG